MMKTQILTPDMLSFLEYKYVPKVKPSAEIDYSLFTSEMRNDSFWFDTHGNFYRYQKILAPHFRRYLSDENKTVQITGTVVGKARKDLDLWFQVNDINCSQSSVKPDILFHSETGTSKYKNAIKNGSKRFDLTIQNNLEFFQEMLRF